MKTKFKYLPLLGILCLTQCKEADFHHPHHPRFPRPLPLLTRGEGRGYGTWRSKDL